MLYERKTNAFICYYCLFAWIERNSQIQILLLLYVIAKKTYKNLLCYFCVDCWTMNILTSYNNVNLNRTRLFIQICIHFIWMSRITFWCSCFLASRIETNIILMIIIIRDRKLEFSWKCLSSSQLISRYKME